MKILGIETPCDETAVAVLEVKRNKLKVLSNVVSSQVKLHAKYGGVVPSLAAREHAKNIEHVFKLALKKAGIWGHRMSSGHPMSKIDLIAVTRGPGLGPSLLVGLSFAKRLAWKYKKPLIGVNHLEGHIYSNWLPSSRSSKLKTLNSKQSQNSNLKFQNIFPILNLIVSGGHTELVLMQDHGKYKIIGETLDDAAGEAFDKVARLLGLGYPGGPQIARHAEQFTRTNAEKKIQHKSASDLCKSAGKLGPIEFPRPMINSKNYNFSYAGLKTSVLYKVRDLKAAGVKITDNIINEMAYEFQKAALDVLVFKTKKAAQEYGVESLFLSGGVSANKELRRRLAEESQKLKINYSQPEMEYTGDNAAMIAAAGYFSSRSNQLGDLKWDKVEMDANLGFG